MKICPSCGLFLVDEKKYSPSKQRKFCSKQCRKIWQNHHQSGKSNPQWKNGKTKDSNGYVVLSIWGKKIREHKKVWEDKNGKLSKGWIIHHLNGIKDDNRIENLCMLPREGHSPKTIIEPFRKRVVELEEEIKNYKGRV